VLFIFRSLYLFAIGLSPVFSFRWSLPPVLSCIPKQPDSRKAPHSREGSGPRTGFSPSTTSCSKEVEPGPRPGGRLFSLQLRPGADFKLELFPLRSPLLRESPLVSFPRLIDMLKFRRWSRPPEVVGKNFNYTGPPPKGSSRRRGRPRSFGRRSGEAQHGPRGAHRER
jgi:hypothetical protein